jgi:hypothetical protein
MIGYSVTAMLVKLATQSGRFSSYFVLMISSAMVVATSTAITVLRGDMKTFSRDNLANSDGMLVLGAGIALVIAVVFFSSRYPKGRPASSFPSMACLSLAAPCSDWFSCTNRSPCAKLSVFYSPPSASILSRAIRRRNELNDQSVETLICESLISEILSEPSKKLKREVVADPDF